MKRAIGVLLLIGLLFLSAGLCLAEFTSSAFVSPLLTRQVYVPSVGTHHVPAHGAGMTTGDCEAVAALGLRWTHGWQRDPMVCPGVEAVPQISALWQIGMPLGGSDQYVIYLNEPESKLQSNVPDPLDAAAGLAQMLDQYPDRIIILPSAPLWYLSEMWDTREFPSERVAANGHCYGWGHLETALVHCTDHANDLRTWSIERGITETWITEFGYDPAWEGMDATEAFMHEMVDYYRAIGITRWAWFQVNSTAGRWTSAELGLWVDGEMTELGAAYRQAD